MNFLILLVVGYLIYLSVRVGHLDKEIKILKGLKSKHSGSDIFTPAVPVPEMVSAGDQMPYAPVTAVPLAPARSGFIPAPTIPSRRYEETPSFDVWAWLQKDFMVKLGALLLLIGFGWFVSYAFANNWIGPMGRIMLGIFAGIIFMMVGVWRLPQSVHQGGTFTVLGSGIVLMTVYAARLLYDFFTPTTALLTMFMSIALVAFVAVRARSQSLAIVGLLMGAVTPLLTNTPEPSTMGLFAYLAVLVLGSLWVMFKIKAEALLLVALGIVFFYGAPYMEMGVEAESLLALLWSFGFTLVFFLGSLVSLLQRSTTTAEGVQIVTAAGTGLYLASWIATTSPAAWQAPLYAIWMVVFAMGAFLVFRATQDRVPFYIYSAVSIGLLGAATSALLDGSILTIVLILEISVIVALAASLTKNQKVTNGLCFLFALPLLLSLQNLISSSWNNGFIHTDFFVLVTLVAGLLLSAQAIREQLRFGVFSDAKVADALTIIASGYVLMLIWLSTHSVLAEDTAIFVSLVIYTVAGMALYVRGVTVKSDSIKWWGGLLIALVVGRLLLIDIWNMEIAGRIVTFIVIGLLLISTAFISKFNKS